MTIEVFHIISLALAPIEQWKYSRLLFNVASPAELWSVTLVVIAVTISLALVFTIILERRRTHRLKKKIATIKATNKMLRQKVDQLKKEQVDILEDIIEAEQPMRKLPGFNPQELKALSELARRLS